MNKILISALTGVCLALTVCSARAQVLNEGIHINNTGTHIEDENLRIDLEIEATGLHLQCDGQLIVELAIENDERRLVLPVVVYSGTLRYRYERRRGTLSDGYHVAPYHIYKGVRKNRSYQLRYQLTVPYYDWMKHAAITCRQYVHSCAGNRQTTNTILLADLTPTPVPAEPEEWAPNAQLFRHLVSFLVPEVEEVKTRASMLELRIGFPVNVTEVRPDFNNNRHELQRADSLVQGLQNNELIHINGVHIRGYASPEGKYAVNEKLARGRSEGFKQYLIQNYPANTYIRNAYTSWVPEDWEGFGRLVEADDYIQNRAEVLAIVNNRQIAPDTKDRLLQNIVWWSNNYKIILKEMYPKLRRIELKVDYTIAKIEDSKARELLYTHPHLLSLDEIYRVARYYEPGSRQYREVYEIAARQYPNDAITNNNAAAALLQEGNATAALPYLQKIGEHPSALINYGAYYYINGDKEKAEEYFNKAKEAGMEQAVHNLNSIK